MMAVRFEVTIVADSLKAVEVGLRWECKARFQQRMRNNTTGFPNGSLL